MLSNGLSSPFLAPYVKQEFTAPILLVGLGVSGYFLLRAFSELPFGVMSDRIGPLKPLLFGKVLTIVAPFICWVATDVYQLVVARAMWGIGDAAFFCVSTVYVTSIFSERYRGKAIGVFTSLEWVGILLGHSLSGFVATYVGIRNIFLLNSVFGVITLFLLIMVRFQGESSDKSSGGSILPSWTMMRPAINSSVLIASVLIFSVMFRSNGIISEFFPLYVTEELGASSIEYGLLTATSTGGAALGMSLGGLISDRLGKKKALALGFGIGVAATYLLAVINTLLLLFPVMIMDGLLYGITYAVAPILVVDSVPSKVRGKAIGIYRTFYDLGGLAGPIVMSVIAMIVGLPYGYIAAFYVTTALIFVNLLIVSLVKTKRESNEEI